MASKKQLKRLTFEHFQDLLEEANNLAMHVRMGLDITWASSVTLTEAHLAAFRLCHPPCFHAQHLLTNPPSLSAQEVTVKPFFIRTDASSEVDNLDVTTIHLNLPLTTTPLITSEVTVGLLLSQTDASSQVASASTHTQDLSSS